MGIFALYLGRVSNLDNFVIGTPILNRTNFKEKQTTGMFINVLPLKFNINHEEKFTEFLSKIAKDSMGLLRHQRYSYNYILEDLRKKDSSLPGLYNILLSYQITKMTDNNDELPHQTSWVFNESTSDDLDIHIFEWNDNNSLQIAYDYKIDKYSEEEISMIHGRILHIINQILNNENILLKEIEIVTEEEKHKILYEFNNTKADYPKDKTIAQLFEEQVEKTPDNIALVFEDQKLTYKELNEKANQLAHYLIENSIKKNNIVAILLDFSISTIISILGILKSGATYLLIDKNLPTDRINYILNNSNTHLLISDNNYIKLNFKKIIYLNNAFNNNLTNNIPNINSSQDPFAVIYTSGSTGLPKGVLLTHFGFINTIYSFIEKLSLEKYLPHLNISNISFDMFSLEIFLCLLLGKKLILTTEEQQKNPINISKLIQKYNIDFFMTTPSKMELFLLNSETRISLKNLKCFLLGGEIFSESLYKNLINFTNAKIFNGYGPTEVSACCSIKEITSTTDINIGKLLPNTGILILDNNLNICPINVPGEIYVFGNGLAKEYLNNIIATKKSFKILNDKILYKTGDLGYFKNNGELIYIGRNDFQIKLHGLRIELNEIDSTIMKVKNIIKSKTIFKNNQLITFFVSNIKNFNTILIKNEINKKLPFYMIPTKFFQIDEFPITSNGKINLQLLNNLKETELINKNIIKPRNNSESVLHNIFIELLKIDNISVDDNFFELGGDSLSAIKLSVCIYDNFKVNVNVSTIFANPSIEQLSILVNNFTKTTKFHLNKIFNAEYYNISSAQKNIYLASELGGKDSLIYNIPGGIIFDKMPDIKKLENCFNTLIQRHESFRTFFEAED